MSDIIPAAERPPEDTDAFAVAEPGERGPPALAVVYLPVAQIAAYETNPRTHSVEQIGQIANSITEFGWTNPCLIDANNELIAGHGRLAAGLTLGMTQIPCIRLGHLTPTQKRALVIADNKLSLNAGWDNELLKLELSDLGGSGFNLDLIGFNLDELTALLSAQAVGLTDPDDAPAAPVHPVSRAGDVWMLGRHRMLCGDCTDVATALAGEDIDIIVTSPPYNQKIDGFKPSGMHREHGWVRKVGSLAYADSMPERDYQAWQVALLGIWNQSMRDTASIFYNHKHRYRDKRVVSPLEWLPGPFTLRQEVIWRRPGSVTQNARMFLPCDERIYWLYKGDDFTFNDTTDIKTWSSVWDIAPRANLSHAVAFPIELPERCIRAASMPDDLVFDPFTGSGTTMIAAETTGRRFVGIDLSPAYVDVAVLRWQNFTGKSATLEASGKTFEEMAAERPFVDPADG